MGGAQGKVAPNARVAAGGCAQAVETEGLAIAIADTLTNFLEDHSACENAEIIVDRCNGRTFVFVNGISFEILLAAPKGMS